MKLRTSTKVMLVSGAASAAFLAPTSYSLYRDEHQTPAPTYERIGQGDYWFGLAPKPHEPVAARVGKAVGRFVTGQIQFECTSEVQTGNLIRGFELMIVAGVAYNVRDYRRRPKARQAPSSTFDNQAWVDDNYDKLLDQRRSSHPRPRPAIYQDDEILQIRGLELPASDELQLRQRSLGGREDGLGF